MKVLIVDDQRAIRTALEVLFEQYGIPTLVASGPSEVLDLIAREDVGVVIQDMNFSANQTSGAEGVELFRAIRKLDADVPVLLMTAYASIEMVVSLVKEGAADYIAKPWDDAKLIRDVKKLLQLRTLAAENARMRALSRRARQSLAVKADLCGLIYSSEAMHRVVSLATSVAPSDAPILIVGPNGSGKEKIAEIVQANSRRRDKPFVKVNAGALPDDLLEAELFGAESGAYTGATKQRIGRFEAAHGGTLFLDEIGTLSMVGQQKLLRVLQTGEFERLGSSATRKVDVRVISATNVDLPRAIASGTFREDLYFRLNVIELQVPSLAERAEDILPLTERFLEGYAQNGAAPRVLSPAARDALLAHDWPGNVRELQNRIQRATLVCQDNTIEPEDLGIGTARPSQRLETADAPPKDADPERAMIEEALVRASGVVSKAAADLGMSRQALYRRMERLDITLERRPKL
ncbi:MAG: sigma-54-dependent Fis family transcriptional regulator [Deltaproteobacteria bacterium]|nr:sigma-54-dependent Fis family transcriptional regulator [Deltaproteobacteria bacterium]